MPYRQLLVRETFAHLEWADSTPIHVEPVARDCPKVVV
eukprot:CAMPEP_0181234494 /NCGR_PEP_ID=MMETSP1096-20121128/37003_1 /TAXON_ID=156174 ORGANISM="Chrysochromulina ericina, Strain CCMP281" /NCGR_SAMPLE_ID=MMETSP1096 /ASSEMBLY_ACC=CAM_ASM_000453 /LENGTH=37 /DNA_ID= /DNA_START= /DNA_END= /DNA_ORIENTATION=